MDVAEDTISGLEMEHWQYPKKKRKDTHRIQLESQKERSKLGGNNFGKIMAKNFPKLTHNYSQIWEIQQIASRINTKEAYWKMKIKRKSLD